MQGKTLRYYIDSLNFTEKIINIVPLPLRFVLNVFAFVSVISIALLFWAQYAHLDFLYKKRSREDDIEFVIIALTVWLPILILGILWLCVVYSKHYCNYMIRKMDK